MFTLAMDTTQIILKKQISKFLIKMIDLILLLSRICLKTRSGGAAEGNERNYEYQI